MPCYSTVQKTSMLLHDRLVQAMELLGWKITEQNELRVSGQMNGEYVTFSRNKVGVPFSTRDSIEINPLQKKYSELGVRAWARAKGFAIVRNDGTRIEMVNRRK